jgi:hypothetical protein
MNHLYYPRLVHFNHIQVNEDVINMDHNPIIYMIPQNFFPHIVKA